jgi:NAD(P)-dependent dehydrogenase (short-subunit alcohol dehydrogenase family)
MREFAGRVAVITGAASGIGKAIAELMAREGMKIVLADIDEYALDTAVEELRQKNLEACGLVTDVSSASSVRDLARFTQEKYGTPHLVCINAGVDGRLDGPIWEATTRDWQWTLGVNFWGVVHGTEVFLPMLLEQGEGHLVITASATGYILPRNMYVVSKHAVVAYVELLYSQLEQLKSPVRVSLLCPGSVATSIFEHERPLKLRNPPDPELDARAAELRRRRVTRNRLGMDPARVAGSLLEGLKEDRFYIFTDSDWDELIRSRFEAVLNRQNPNPGPADA